MTLASLIVCWSCERRKVEEIEADRPASSCSHPPPTSGKTKKKTQTNTKRFLYYHAINQTPPPTLVQLKFINPFSSFPTFDFQPCLSNVRSFFPSESYGIQLTLLLNLYIYISIYLNKKLYINHKVKW